MLDIVMLALVLGFFVAGNGYAYDCERLKRSRAMTFDYSLAGLVALGLLLYLTYALLRPERF